METKTELRRMLQRLEAKWEKGNLGSPFEIVKLDRQIKEVKRKIQELEIKL